MSTANHFILKMVSVWPVACHMLRISRSINAHCRRRGCKAAGCVRIDMLTDLGYLITRTVSSYADGTSDNRMLSLVIALAFAKKGSTIKPCFGRILPVNRENFLLSPRSIPGPCYPLSGPYFGGMSQGSLKVQTSGWEV